MAKTRHGKNPGGDSQEEDVQEVIEVSDTTAGGSTAPEDNPDEDYICNDRSLQACKSSFPAPLTELAPKRMLLTL